MNRLTERGTHTHGKRIFALKTIFKQPEQTFMVSFIFVEFTQIHYLIRGIFVGNIPSTKTQTPSFRNE